MSQPQFFVVTVESDGRKVLTIDHCSQSGVVDLSDRDYEMIYEAAAHLLAFLGQPSPDPYEKSPFWVDDEEQDDDGGAE